MKFVARVLIRRNFVLPPCMIFKCGQFNLYPTWDTAKIVSLTIILCILKVERHAQYVDMWSPLSDSRPYLEVNLSKQSREDNYDCKTILRSFSMKNYMYVTILMVIGQTVSKSIKDPQTDIHFYMYRLFFLVNFAILGVKFKSHPSWT